MNLSNLPFFILFFAIVYLSIVYGLLKIAETQGHNVSNHVSNNFTTVSRPTGSKQQIKTP
ncbi:MAG: hypothetical protein ACRC1Z_25940 [Waterburya sp.]